MDGRKARMHTHGVCEGGRHGGIWQEGVDVAGCSEFIFVVFRCRMPKHGNATLFSTPFLTSGPRFRSRSCSCSFAGCQLSQRSPSFAPIVLVASQGGLGEAEPEAEPIEVLSQSPLTLTELELPIPDTHIDKETPGDADLSELDPACARWRLAHLLPNPGLPRFLGHCCLRGAFMESRRCRPVTMCHHGLRYR